MEPGHSGQAWALLGAIGQATERIEVGTGVTAPVHRYNPAVVAQLGATLQELFAGRGFLGIGSGEALNETPCGLNWPGTAEQVRRLEEALEIIGRLLDGERLDHEGRFFRTNAAYLHTRGERRPPVYVSAFGPEAATVAARYGDGLWTLADPESAPELIDAYRSARDDSGREPGEIILQTGMSWAQDDEAALEGARVWKATLLDEYFTDDWHDPKTMYERAETKVSDDELRGSRPAGRTTHLRRARAAGSEGCQGVRARPAAPGRGASPRPVKHSLLIDLVPLGPLPGLRLRVLGGMRLAGTAAAGI